MALWCRDVATVEVPQEAAPTKRLTLVLPFYENHDFLRTQIAGWWTWPAALREHVTAIVVDDGSPRPLDLRGTDAPFPLRVFRIEVDVRWNWLAARNIGAHHAADGWLLLTDMDHVLPADTLRAVLHGRHDERVAYAFGRREHDGRPAAPHSASFLMTRQLFWRVGGYDERLSGHYGTDGVYRRRLAAQAPLRLLNEQLVRHEHLGDSSTRAYGRKEPQDGRGRWLARALAGTAPRVLTFPYHEVTPCQ